jgi:hypothetical protein
MISGSFEQLMGLDVPLAFGLLDRDNPGRGRRGPGVGGACGL